MILKNGDKIMKFNSVKELENFLRNVTSTKDIQQDISYKNVSGVPVTVKFIGAGTVSGVNNMVWMSNVDVNVVQIEYTGDNNSIVVSKVKVTKA
jgi:hypothetical protein